MLHQVASAISLTKQGADKLAAGEYFAAASAFCAAIKRTQALAADTAEESTNSATSIMSTATEGEQQDFDNDDGAGIVIRKQQPWTYEALPVLSPSSAHNEIAIFEHCFVVVPAKKSSQLQAFTTQDCELFTAALIYNLALTYHYCGVCGNSNERMTDALNLYEKASSIIGNADDATDGMAVFLAVSNNAASLSLVLQNMIKYQRFQACLQRLLKEKNDFYAPFFLQNTMAQVGGAAIHNIPAQ